MATEPEILTALDLQRRGGFARAQKLTSEQRTRIAKLAAEARWQRKKAPLPTPPDGGGANRKALPELDRGVRRKAVVNSEGHRRARGAKGVAA